jgi:hypothetical protein
VSHLAQPNGDDFPEAADKLVDDSRELHRGNRHDGAAYLAGYVVECCLKTILLLERQTSWGHLAHLTRQISAMGLVAGSRTAKYISSPVVRQLPTSPVMNWEQSMRYRGPGFVSPSAAADWVRDAKAVYDATIVEMRLDGVI